jgi:hypothetical protein
MLPLLFQRGTVKNQFMNRFTIVPISAAYAAQVRSVGFDPFGHAVTEQVATGYGPCRVSLKPFEVGVDIRLLFSYSPFEVNNAFNQPGPVFIHKKAVDPYRDLHRFPPEIKADKEHFPLTLIGYSAGQQMVYARLVGNDDVDELIPELFNRHPDIAYLHARNAEAGCYICRINRN